MHPLSKQSGWYISSLYKRSGWSASTRGHVEPPQLPPECSRLLSPVYLIKPNPEETLLLIPPSPPPSHSLHYPTYVCIASSLKSSIAASWEGVIASGEWECDMAPFCQTKKERNIGADSRGSRRVWGGTQRWVLEEKGPVWKSKKLQKQALEEVDRF